MVQGSIEPGSPMYICILAFVQRDYIVNTIVNALK